MVIPQKYTAIAVKYTDSKRKNQGVVFDDNYLENYKSKLRNIAKERNIKEGSTLENADWYSVFADIFYLMKDSSERVAKMDEKFRTNVNARNYVLSALNYLLALTESELGSPDIPAENFSQQFSYWTRNVISAKPVTNISLDDTFDNQRGIDSIELQEEIIQPILDDIKANKNLSENVGKLYAEYQALVRRQANHGFFWRLFHSAENSARTALIKELEVTLKQYAPNIDLTAKTPEKTVNVIRSAAETQTLKEINVGDGLYKRDVPNTFGYVENVINDQLENMKPENKQPEIDQNNIIAQDDDNKAKSEENENVNEVEVKEEVKEENVIEKEVKEEVKEENVIEKEVKEEVKEEIQEASADVINENLEDDDITLDEILEIISSEDFAAQLADAIWKAIDKKVDRSIKKEAVTGDIVNKMISAATTFNEVYYDVKAVGDDTEKLNEVIDDSMPLIYSEAFNSLDGCNMEITDQVVSAQIVSDIVLNKATVVGFNGAKYSKFANNYAVANGTLVSETLESSERNLSEDSINAIVSNAKRELNVKAVEAPNPVLMENVPVEQIKEDPKVEEVEVQRKAEEEAKRKVEEEEAQRKADEEAKRKAEEEEARRKADEEAKRKAEEEEAQRKADEEAKRKAEEKEAQRKAEEEAKRKAEEEEARRKAEEEEAKAEENKVESVEDKNVTPIEFAFIYDQVDKRAGDSQLTASVKGELRRILANSGVDKSKVNSTADAVFEKCLFDNNDGIAAYYQHLNSDMTASQKSRYASSIMDMMLTGVGNNLRAVLNESISNDADKMVAHQKLLDVIFKNYSPAAISDSFNQKYLNNYFLDDSKNLESYYRTYINRNASAADVDVFAKSVEEARARIESSNIVVEVPEVEEQPKAKEEPKVEAQPNIVEEPEIEVQPEVEAQPQVEETKIADIELTVGEYISPVEFASIYNRADKSVGNSQLTESVKGQMREILANSGVDNAKLDETVDKVFKNSLFDNNDGIAAHYNYLNADMSASASSRSSSSIMEMMIKGAGNNIHLALNGNFSNAIEQMVVHQKLLDVLLNSYSPAAFSKGIDEKYLNNYFLGDSKNLESYYRTYINKNASATEVEGFANSVSEILVKGDEAPIKAEEEAKRKVEEEEARRKAEEEAKRKAEEEEARRKAEEEAKRKAEEEEARRKAEEEAKRKAEEEEARRKASEDPSVEEARKLSVQQNVAEAIAADNTPHVNIRMHKQCVDAVNSNELAQSVRQQLKNIKDDDELINDVCRLPREKILNIYRNATANNTNMYSRLAATEMVRELFIDIYRLTVKHDYTQMGMRVFMAQEMADVLMRNYSPVAFVPKVFDDAADYYIVGHKSILNNTMLKAHPNVYKYYTEKEKDKVVDYGRSSKEGTGQVEAYIKRRDSYKKEIQEYIDQNKAMGANVLDADYIREDVISAYRVQYLDACGATKAIKANVNDVKTILDKAGVNESDKNAQKFVDGIMFEMPSIYDNASHFARLNGTFGDMMSYMSNEVFYRAYGNIQGYDGINEITRLALAQQLADVILKAYSPAKFNDACKPEYTNGFAISNAANIKVALDKNNIKLTDEEISQLKEDVAYANEHLGEALGEGKVDIIAEYKRIEEQKRLDEEARIKAEEEAKRKAEEEEAQRRAEEEAKRKAEEEEAQRRADEEAKKKAEEEEAQRKAEEEAKKKAEEEEAKRKAEEEAKKKAEEEEAQRKAEEEAKKKAEEDAKTKPAEEEAKKKADEIEARWAIENKQLSEERKQILEQKKVADDIRAVYKDKLQEMKLAGVSVHELVEAEFEIAATGPSNFSVEVSERLEKIYKDQYMPNAIGKILGNAISNKEERRVLVNSIIDTVRRNMISLYSTAEENKINIFSLSESYKCLENTFKEVYRLTANCGYDFTNHIIVAQKITDEFMKNWSPANKSYLAKEMHCSGYFVGSSDMLQGVIPEYNKSLHWNDIDQAIKKDADYSKQLTKSKNEYKKTIQSLKRIVNNSLASLTENSHIGSGLLLGFTTLFNYNVSAAGASQCRKEIAEVFKEIDSNANGRSERFFSEMKFDLRKMYSDLNKYTNYDVTFKDVMTYMSKKTFELCYHQHLKDDNLTKEKRIELSQKLSNLILARYSLLAGTAKVSKDKYMDFVIRDENVLNDILENSERVNKANARAEEAKEMQKVAAKAQLELKRNYKRVIANPIPTDGKIEQPFIRACREELRQSFNDSRLTEAFKLQVVKVLNDFGVENVAATNAANAIFAKVSDKDEGMYKIYKALESYVEWGRDPKLFVDEMITETTKEYRKLVTDCFEDPAIGIIASRNVMDVILKNYSPAAFAKGDTLMNQVNSYLFESNSINGNAYFHNYFNDSNYKKDFPEGKIPSHNDRSDFIKWIKDANEKLEREAEAKRVAAARRERKPVEKYERKVKGIQLSLREGKDDDYILTDVDIDVFRDECKNSFADNNLTAYVKWQIGEILADSGVEYSKIQGTVDNIFTKCSGNNGVLSFYDKTSATSVLHDGMIYSDATMKNIVQRSMGFISKATEECYSSFEEGFATNQRILDVILKNYSPVAFTQGKLDRYANGFLVKNDGAFGQYYQGHVKNIGWYGIKPVMDKVREIYANLGKNVPASDKEKISVDLNKAVSEAPNAEAPKVDVPKVDAPKVEANETAKERIVVNEALDNMVGIKSSDKVKEPNAPVSSKSKE